jgi:AcrR family transcriptional regulator
MARDGSLVEPRRRLTGEDRRAEILRAARTVFAQHGFDGASTAVIAAKAGCSEPTLYKHFASKHALFAAVLADAGLAMKALVADALAEADDRFEALVALVMRLQQNEDFCEVSRLRQLAITLDDPAIRDVLLQSMNGQRTTFATAVAKAQERGTVRDDVDPDAVGYLAVALSLLSSYRHAIEGPAGRRDTTRVMSAVVTLLQHPPGGPA